MRTRARLLPFLLMAVALLAVVACSDDDSNAERQTADATASATTAAGQSNATQTGGSAAATQAPANATRALELDCGRDFKSFRFTGELSLKAPQGGSSASDLTSVVGSLLEDVKFTGAYAAPDRTQLKLDGGQNSPLGTIEFIQIGNTSYTKLGSAAWQQSQANGATSGIVDQVDPREICRQFEQSLTGDVPSRKEQVNGVEATRYDYDRTALEKLGSGDGFLGAIGGSGEDLPENTKMSVWVSDKDKFPVKMQIDASGTQAGEDFAIKMSLNVTDLNGNVTINAPR